MDKDQGKADKDRKEGLGIPPREDGLIRSARLPNQLEPPPSPPGEAGIGGGRKRPRLQQEEKGPRKEAGDGDVDDVKVNPEANVKAVSEAEGEEEKTSTGDRSLPLGEQAKVDVTVKGGRASSSSAGIAGFRTLRSEVVASENVRAPALESSPLGLDQLAIGGGGANKSSADLQNPVVLTNLFEVCRSSDLATFRLVCKEWRRLSLTAWRKSSTLKLTTNCGRFYIEGGTTLAKFLKYVEDPGNECGVKPFRRLLMDGWIVNTCKPQMKRFWNLTGSYLTSLNLSCFRFSDAEELWKMAYVICPNLVRLSLRYCSFGSGQNVDHSDQPQLQYQEPVRGKHGHLKSLVIFLTELPVSWLELLSHFQSLTSLDVLAVWYHWADPPSPPVCESLLKAIAVIRKHGGDKLPLPIKRFNVGPFVITHNRDSRHQFDLLQELNLPLPSLSLVVRAHPDLDLEMVGDILERHSGTLETLELNGCENGWRSRRMTEKFPCRVQLEKLQDLRIKWVERVGLESTEILKCVPNLRSLSIYGQYNKGDHLECTLEALADWQADNNGVGLLPKLTKFTSQEDFVGQENLIAFTKLMPNVEELKILLWGDEEFSIVCDNWRGLKELTLESDGQEGADALTDKGVTGGSPKKTETKPPNITDLKELRSFSCCSNKLTEVSVYNGFMKLPNLRSLTLSSKYATSGGENAKPYCFGNQARKDLREKGIKLHFE